MNMSMVTLSGILTAHKRWLENKEQEDACRANLRGANLGGADLRGANLEGVTSDEHTRGLAWREAQALGPPQEAEVAE